MNIMFSCNGLSCEDFFEFREWSNLNFPIHCHYSVEFVFCKSGSLIVEKEETAFSLTEGDLLVVMPFEKHSFVSHKESETFIVQFSPKLISQYDTMFRNKRFKNPLLKLSSYDTAKIYDFLCGENFDHRVAANYIFFQAAAGLMKNNELISFGGNDDLFCRVLLYVSNHFEEDLTLKKIAVEMNVSYEYLSRMFIEKSGMHFSDFVCTFRLQKALALFGDSSKNISQICFSCGFGSIRNFNKVFLREMKCTPSEYRKNLALAKSFKPESA